MKDYYDILDVPLTASQDEIRLRYKQLVRIYHPDRFTNPLDKLYAEQKLKEVNTAFAYLTNAAAHLPAPAPVTSLPAPTVEPAVLDFGLLRPGQRQTLQFVVDNHGAVASGIHFVCSDDNGWFRVSNGRRIDDEKPLPLTFEVVADIQALAPSRRYDGWIEINMDGVTARVQVVAQAKALRPRGLPRIGLFVSLCVLALLAIGVVRYQPIGSMLLTSDWLAAPGLRPYETTVAAVEADRKGAAASRGILQPVVAAGLAPPTQTPTWTPTHTEAGDYAVAGQQQALADNALAATAVSATPSHTPSAQPTATNAEPATATRQPPATSTATATLAATRATDRQRATGVAPLNVISATRTPPARTTSTQTATQLPSPTAASSATASATVEPTASKTPTSAVITLTATPSQTATATASATSTATSTASPSPSATATVTPSVTPSSTATRTPTATATATATHTPTPTPTNTPTATLTATATDTSAPTPRPTVAPTDTPAPTNTAPPESAGDDGAAVTVEVVVAGPFRVNVRATNSVESQRVATLEVGSSVTAIARTIDNTWLQIELPDGQIGWVFRETIGAPVEMIDELPVVYTS